jgi:hypothetical protein
MHDQSSPDATMPAPARPDGAVTHIPWVDRHLQWLFWACAAGLAPWVVFLSLSQVPRAQAHKIHLLAGLSRSVLAASFAATATFISAWFRTLTQAGGSNWAGSIPTFLVIVVMIVGLCVIVIRSELSARVHPRWMPVALAIGALVLVPSLVVVLTVVPKVETAHHLRVAWTGLDVFEVLALAATGFALQRRPAIVVVPATITGTLLLCDAWLNIIPTTGVAFYEGIVMAFIELPLAAISFSVAARASAEPSSPLPRP